MLNNYDETILMEMKKTSLQKLQLVKRLKTTLEGHIKTIDDLMNVRRANAVMETEIKALEERQKELKERLESASGAQA